MKENYSRQYIKSAEDLRVILNKLHADSWDLSLVEVYLDPEIYPDSGRHINVAIAVAIDLSFDDSAHREDYPNSISLQGDFWNCKKRR